MKNVIRKDELTIILIDDVAKVKGEYEIVEFSIYISSNGISFSPEIYVARGDNLFFTHDEMKQIMEEAKRFKEEN